MQSFWVHRNIVNGVGLEILYRKSAPLNLRLIGFRARYHSFYCSYFTDKICTVHLRWKSFFCLSSPEAHIEPTCLIANKLTAEAVQQNVFAVINPTSIRGHFVQASHVVPRSSEETKPSTWTPSCQSRGSRHQVSWFFRRRNLHQFQPMESS